jgi:hypothetical protein
MNRLVIVLALTCFAAGASAANKQVYKWTDANGVVHYTDAPPPKDTKDVKAVRVIGDTTSEAAPPADKPAEDKAKPAADDKPKAEEPTPEDAAKERAAKCDQAKLSLSLLQSNFPVTEVTASGEHKPVEDKDREARAAGVKQRIADLCGP